MAETSPSNIPPEPDVLPYDAIAHLRTDAVRFLELVTDHGFDHPVPSCPGWDLGDLAWHLGTVWERWGRIVSEQVTTLEGVQDLGRPDRPSDDLLIDWVTAAHTSMFSALAGAPDDTEVWTWTGANRSARWVERRMTQETAVHRWDAATAVGVPYDIPTAVAADGIDEFLMWFAGRRVSDAAVPVGGSVHLHCTDTDSEVSEGADDRTRAIGEWTVTRLDETGIEFTRAHAKGDAAVRGRADDLLLWLWRRDAGEVEILGDVGVAERFRAFPAL
jgi:uncharacterized protein (TIGR03083 family)